MPRNFRFTVLIKNRPVLHWGIGIMLLATLFLASSFKKNSDRDLRAKEVNLTIRQLGHRLLLLSGDSTSRVLPVTEIAEGTFLLKFENKLLFSHDSLLTLSRALLPENDFPGGYMVTVHDCEKGAIVFGFQLNNNSPDRLACSGRHEPAGCYTIEFAFKDFYDNVHEKKAKVDPRTKEQQAIPVDQHASSRKLADLNSTNPFDNELDRATEEVPTLKGETRAANAATDDSQNGSLINILYSAIIVLLLVGFLIWRFGKPSTQGAAQTESQAIIGDSHPESANLGQFLFDVKGQSLQFRNELISLTDKECKVLDLLHKNFGELIPRDVLMQKVWIDEGVITGRSLDMFISKLRKKLSRDPELRITNVHGRGYKLEVSKENS